MSSTLLEALHARTVVSTSLTVTDADTAVTVGSGDVPVLATPRVLALLEEATVLLAGPRLRGEETSVGARVTLTHSAATPPGRTVVAEAWLASVDGRTLTFGTRLLDGETVAAEAEIIRVVVDRTRFLSRLR